MNFCFKYNTNIVKSTNINNKYNIKKYAGKNVESVDFVNQHSIKDNHLQFSNMLQRNNSPRITMLVNVISDLINNPNNLDYYFEGREISMITKKDKDKLDRLNNILKLNDNVPNNEMLIKYVPNYNFYKYYVNDSNKKNERGFQIFHTRDKLGNVKIYLIDLYHLAIPSKTNNTLKEYVNVMEYRKDIYDSIFSKVSSLV